MSWSQLNAGATIPHEHATGCNSMQIPSSKQDTSWAPLGCSSETCSLSEETKSRTATASRASCHETLTTGESLPHFRRCVSSGGALPSTAVYALLPVTRQVLYRRYVGDIGKRDSYHVIWVDQTKANKELEVNDSDLYDLKSIP